MLEIDISYEVNKKNCDWSVHQFQIQFDISIIL